MSCLLCDNGAPPREQPPHWNSWHVLCGEHARLARLRDGSDLMSLPGALGDIPAQMAHMLNPLDVDGRACWAIWPMGGPVVVLEVHPSASYWEFRLQHDPQQLHLLAAVHERREHISSGEGMLKSLRYLELSQYGFAYEELTTVADDWQRSTRYPEMLRTRGGLPRDAAEQQTIFEQIEPCSLSPDEMPRFVDALLALAARRLQG